MFFFIVSAGDSLSVHFLRDILDFRVNLSELLEVLGGAEVDYIRGDAGLKTERLRKLTGVIKHDKIPIMIH